MPRPTNRRIADLQRRVTDLEREAATLRAKNHALRLLPPDATTELAKSIAHELSNLLQTIGGKAELVLDDASTPVQTREQWQAVLDAVASGADLTRQLLAFGNPGKEPEFVVAPKKAPNAVRRKDDRSKRTNIPGRILVAEDQKAIQDLVRTVLSNAGHQVTVVASGAEAIAAIQKSTFDLVLMDMQMPIMDGLSAARKIGQLLGARSKVPIIAASGAMPTDIAESLAEAGIDDGISKPFNFLELIRKIDFWLNETRSQVEAREAASSNAEGVSLVELDGLMGRAWLERALAGFIEKIDELFSAHQPIMAPDRERLASCAHALVSLAGLLGFSDLSQRCSLLEEAARSEGDIVSPLNRAKAMATRARKKAVELLNRH